MAGVDVSLLRRRQELSVHTAPSRTDGASCLWTWSPREPPPPPRAFLTPPPPPEPSSPPSFLGDPAGPGPSQGRHTGQWPGRVGRTQMRRGGRWWPQLLPGVSDSRSSVCPATSASSADSPVLKLGTAGGDGGCSRHGTPIPSSTHLAGVLWEGHCSSLSIGKAGTPGVTGSLKVSRWVHGNRAGPLKVMRDLRTNCPHRARSRGAAGVTEIRGPRRFLQRLAPEQRPPAPPRSGA